MQTSNKLYTAEPNRDPITGAPGAHPVGTGIGAAVGGAVAGAGIGTTAGPIGTLVGAALGAVVGGLAGKSVAETIDPTSEVAYWRDNFSERSYAGPEDSFDNFEPAYGYGVAAYVRYPDRGFDELDADLSRDWVNARGRSNLEWARAREAARDAWIRVGGPL